jgi:urea transport system substrate-binding protein
VEAARTDDPAVVVGAMASQSYPAPEGIVSIDAATLHAWKTVRIGEFNREGRFTVRWTSERPIRPFPFPAWRTRAEWARFLDTLYAGWGGRWEAPHGSPETPRRP